MSLMDSKSIEANQRQVANDKLQGTSKQKQLKAHINSLGYLVVPKSGGNDLAKPLMVYNKRYTSGSGGLVRTFNNIEEAYSYFTSK